MAPSVTTKDSQTASEDGLSPNENSSNCFGTSPATSGSNVEGHFVLKTSLFSRKVRRDILGDEICNESGTTYKYHTLPSHHVQPASVQQSTPRMCPNESDVHLRAEYMKHLSSSSDVTSNVTKWLQKVSIPADPKSDEPVSLEPESERTAKAAKSQVGNKQSPVYPSTVAIAPTRNQTGNADNGSQASSKAEDSEDETEDSNDSQRS